MKHTPGPWKDDGHMNVIVETDGTSATQICCVYGRNGIANACLIAAAPELLEALEAIVEHFGDPLKVALPAIAKARGRS